MAPWTLFSVKTDFSTFVELVLNEDGTMSLASSSSGTSTPTLIHFGKCKVVKCRWTHVALVYHPNKVNPNIRTYVAHVYVQLG